MDEIHHINENEKLDKTHETYWILFTWIIFDYADEIGDTDEKW
jgi:hypothetical protein